MFEQLKEKKRKVKLRTDKRIERLEIERTTRKKCNSLCLEQITCAISVSNLEFNAQVILHYPSPQLSHLAHTVSLCVFVSEGEREQRRI